MSDGKLNTLRELLSGGEQSLYHACEIFIQHMEQWNKQEQLEYLRLFLEQVEISDLTENVTEDFLDIPNPPGENLKDLFKLENRVISNLIQENVTAEQFYQELYEKLTDSSLIPSAEVRVIFLHILWRDRRIPYFQLEKGVEMDSEQYQQIIDKIRPSLDKGNYILNTQLRYKTQRSSLLMDVANKLENDTDRVVFWAVLLDRILRMEQLLRIQKNQRSKQEAGSEAETFPQ